MVSKLRVEELETLDGLDNVKVSDLASLNTPASTYKIAVVGDSLSTANAIFDSPWTTLLEDYLNQSGGDRKVEVVNYARNSFTFLEANTDANAYGNQTARDAVIDEAPHLIVVSLGVVDVLANESSRSLANLKNDALTFYQAVRTALPNTKIVHAKHICFDDINGNINSLRNKDIIPYFFNLRSSGILSGCYSPEILDDSISAQMQSNYEDTEEFYDYIEALPEVDAMIDINLWKIARLGLMGPDGLHLRTLSRFFQTGYFLKGLVASNIDPFFDSIGDKKVLPWYDPDVAIHSLIDPNDDWSFDYLVNWPYTAASANSLAKDFAPDSWFYPNKTSLSLARDNFDHGAPFHLSIFNGPPLAPLVPSVDGGAWQSTPSVTLTQSGNASVSDVNPIAPGTYIFRYKAGNEVYGPFSFTFNPATGLTLAEGGTGATSAAGARASLDVYSKAESDALSGGGGGGGISQPDADARYLLESNNLSDLTNSASARNNLGVNDTGPISFSINAGWLSGSAGGYKNPAYYRDHNGRVYLEGAVRRASGSTVVPFSLPAGYRPSSGIGFCAPIEGQPEVMLINSDGTVEIAGYTTNGDYAFIDGINFMT